MKKITVAGLLWTFFNVQVAFGQTGPGGVGNATSNFLWLKADAGTSSSVNGNPISQWNDQSGNSNNVSQATAAFRPVFRSGLPGVMNGKPLIEFDNDATNHDYLSVNDNTTLDGFTGFTSFGVFRLRNGAAAGIPRALYSKRFDPGSGYCYSMFHYTGGKMYLDINSSGTGRMASTGTYNTLTDYISGATFDPSLASNQQKIFTGASTNDGQQTNAGTGISNQNSNLHIGTLFGHTGSSRQFDGFIGEVILFNRVVNDAEMRVINNYLSSKYNIPLASNDFYQGDTPANGDFDFEVAGIGQVSTTHRHLQFSPSASAGLGLTYQSGFDNGDYVFAGHNLVANANIDTDLAVTAGGPIDRRWQRVWYIDVTNTGAAVAAHVVFDISDGGFPNVTAGPASNYKLLFRSTNSGNWNVVATASSVSGDQITFGSYNFSSNSQDGYYTIGTLNNALSPLPITLLAFDARLNNGHTDLIWTTASEINNAYFTIERSSEGNDWTEILQAAGAGNSNTTIHYSAVDRFPLKGVSYYRLKQTDTDGTFSYSKVVAVYNTGSGHEGMILYPNPGNGNSFHILLGRPLSATSAVVEIHDLQGKKWYSQHYQTELHTTSLEIELASKLADGIYTVSVSAGGITQVEKLVIE